MKIFINTCALFKLYHTETGTQQIEKIFTENTISKVFLSELTKIEFSSTLWKKVRTKEITEFQAKQLISIFEKDITIYDVVSIDSLIIERAVRLLTKYGKSGLRQKFNRS